MKKVNWGIIGLGNIANEFANSMISLHSIYAVASRNQDKANAFKDKYDCEVYYDSYDRLIEDSNVDIVYIATVNSQHYTNIMECLRHGKHVLCEKAIWSNYDELKEAYEYAKNHNLVLCEAMTIYHMPLFKKIKQMIEAGELGKLKFVQADLGSLKEDNPNNRFFSKELGGGAMLDIGTYTLSFLRYFMPGKISDIEHVCAKYSTGVDEMWCINLKDDNGILGNANMTFRAKLPKRGVVAGDKAYVVIYNYVRADVATLVYPDGIEKRIEVGNTQNALEYEIIDIEQKVLDDTATDYMDLTMDVVYLMDYLLKAENL